MDNKCESLCEDAPEILQESVAADASLQIWFDRNLDFGHGSLIDASLGNLPRLVTSRSIEKQHDDSCIVKKLDVKIGVVERAINNLGRAVELDFPDFTRHFLAWKNSLLQTALEKCLQCDYVV